MVGICADEDEAAMKRMLGRTGMDWPQILQGPDSELLKLFDAGLPAYVVLDRAGRIAGKYVGARGLEYVNGVLAKTLPR